MRLAWHYIMHYIVGEIIILRPYLMHTGQPSFPLVNLEWRVWDFMEE